MSERTAAKLAQLEDWKRMAVWFDGGPELLSHEAMHRHHETEPYIGCLFCRARFMPREVTDELVDRVWCALDDLMPNGGETPPPMKVVRAALEAALGGCFPAKQAEGHA